MVEGLPDDVAGSLLTVVEHREQLAVEAALDDEHRVDRDVQAEAVAGEFGRQGVGQARHVGDFFFVVVRVLIVLAVTEIFHQASRRVAQVQRHVIGFGLLHVFAQGAEGGVERVGFWR